MKMISSFFWFLLCGAIQSSFAQTNLSVLPPDKQNQPGNSYDSLFSSGGDFQQLFRGSTFPNGKIEITEIAFRVGSNIGSSFAATIPKVEIHLSTSSRAPEQITSNWNLNNGSDDQIIYLHNNVSLFGTGNSVINPFDLKFPLDSPFFYDPDAGHLAMYIRMTGTPFGTRTVDAEGYISLDANTPTSSFGPAFAGPAAYGIITEFTWISVPEPRPNSLFLAVGALLMIFRKIPKGKRLKT